MEQGMKCPKCHSDNYAWYQYCRDCCTELEFSEEAQSFLTESHSASQKELIIDLKQRAKKINIYFEYDTVTQDISTFLDHTFRHENNSLVILGRFKKPVKLPFISLDKKIETSKKLEANVLMLK